MHDTNGVASIIDLLIVKYSLYSQIYCICNVLYGLKLFYSGIDTKTVSVLQNLKKN